MYQTIELSDPRILKFYNANPTISVEAVNLLFIDLIEKLFVDANSAIHSHMIHSINDNTSEIKRSITALNELLVASKTENKLDLFSKMTEIKDDYIHEINSIVDTKTIDKMTALIEKNNATLLDKTAIVLNEIVPKSNSQVHKQIQDTLSQFHNSLSTDTANLIKNSDTNSVKEFVQNFEMKTTMLIQTLQQPLYSFITASEERINNNMNSIKDINQTNQMSHHKLLTDIDDFLKKFRSGAENNQTQSFHNNQMSNVLTRMYNSAEIHIQPSAMNSSGTILLKRLRKPNILVENKDYPENISVDEINNFMSLIEEHNCNGIFVSQNSGISNKKNYQIDILNNNIVVFLHSVEYCSTKISSAVDIIDHLSMKMRTYKDTTKNEDITIPKDVLDTINDEYQLFMNQKNAVIDVLKESQKKVLSQLDEVRFPCLDKFLSTKYSLPVQKTGLKCDVCKLFNANNLKALAAHKRGCNRKNIAAHANALVVGVSTA